MKILNWNIQSGGGKRIDRIVERILFHSPDFVILTEFRKVNEVRLTDGLRKGGFQWFESSNPQGNENGLLVASKVELHVNTPGSHEEDPQRWLSLYLPQYEMHLIAVHIPGSPDHKFIDGVGISGSKRKEIFWEKVIEFASNHRSEQVIFGGDFNTGLKADTEGAPFLLSKYMTNLIDLGYVDAWRAIHNEERDFTWYSQRKVNGVTRDFNGFRLDYIFVSPSLSSYIHDSFHSHEERVQKISDHSAVGCELRLQVSEQTTTKRRAEG